MHIIALVMVIARQPYRSQSDVLSGAVKYKTEAGRDPTQAVDQNETFNLSYTLLLRREVLPLITLYSAHATTRTKLRLELLLVTLVAR